MSGNKADFDTPHIHASEAVVLVHAEIHINAPAQDVFRSLRNVETWKDWNRFIPKVNITFQPPEDDHVTSAEIQEIVRNTSIIGSFDSDLTDGSDGYGLHGPNEQPPPRFRLSSVSSQASRASSDSRRPRVSESLEAPPNVNGLRKGSVSSTGSTKSGAQRFQEAQEARRASVAGGHEPPPIVNALENSRNHRASIAYAATTSTTKSDGQKAEGRHLQSSSTRAAERKKAAAEKAYASLMAMYGEPSVRLMIGTKMTLFSRMKENNPSDFTQTNVVVTDVSRPDDPVTEMDTDELTRSKTHNLEGSGLYRIVWVVDSEGASLFHIGSILSGTKLPKFVLQAERVHEIRPTTDGAGNPTCFYRTWEAMKGPGAKAVKKKYDAHLERMFNFWCKGLKDFCESLQPPNVDVRDFSIVAENPAIIQSVT